MENELEQLHKMVLDRPWTEDERSRQLAWGLFRLYRRASAAELGGFVARVCRHRVCMPGLGMPHRIDGCMVYIPDPCQGLYNVTRLYLDDDQPDDPESPHQYYDLPVHRGSESYECWTLLARVFYIEGIRRRRRERCVAFAMGGHERLGGDSLVLALDAGVAEMILRLVVGCY